MNAYSFKTNSTQSLIVLTNKQSTYFDLLPISDKEAEWFWFRKKIFRKLDILGCINVTTRERYGDLVIYPNAPYIPTFNRNKGYGKALYLAAIQFARNNNVALFAQHAFFVKQAKVSKSAKRVYQSLVRDNYLVPKYMELFSISQKPIDIIINQFQQENK